MCLLPEKGTAALHTFLCAVLLQVWFAQQRKDGVYCFSNKSSQAGDVCVCVCAQCVHVLGLQHLLCASAGLRNECVHVLPQERCVGVLYLLEKESYPLHC